MWEGYLLEVVHHFGQLCSWIVVARWATAALLATAIAPVGAQVGTPLTAALLLPDAPEPQFMSPIPKPNPCVTVNRRPAAPEGPAPAVRNIHSAAVPCTTRPLNAWERFLNGPHGAPLTPREKGWLAARNVADPFNAITILGEGALAVGLDSHMAVGPGMAGYGRYVGISFAQDMTAEFFGTFVIASVTHMDPHYHRMEGRPIPRRVAHAITQVVWARSDYGRGMPNYSALVGCPIDDAISNLYVPGRRTDPQATARRCAVGLATAPIGNFVSEFLPDVASHIHVQVVLVQRIINQVARAASSGSNGQMPDQ